MSKSVVGSGTGARVGAAFERNANRHTWASRLTMAGVDPRIIMALGGGSNMGMLARYTHLAPGHRIGTETVEALTSKSLSSKRRFASADRAQRPSRGQPRHTVLLRNVLFWRRIHSE